MDLRADFKELKPKPRKNEKIRYLKEKFVEEELLFKG